MTFTYSFPHMLALVAFVILAVSFQQYLDVQKEQGASPTGIVASIIRRWVAVFWIIALVLFALGASPS